MKLQARGPAVLRVGHASKEAGMALCAMGDGMRLRIPHAGEDGAEIVEGLRRYGRRRPSFAVSRECLAEMLAGCIVVISEARSLYFMIAKLTERTVNSKLGWRECDYDGDVADWYACIQ